VKLDSLPLLCFSYWEAGPCSGHGGR